MYNNIKRYNARINIVIVFYAHDDHDHDDVADNDDDENYHHHCDHQNLSDITKGQFNKTFTRVIYKCSCCFQTLKQWLHL